MTLSSNVDLYDRIEYLVPQPVREAILSNNQKVDVKAPLLINSFKGSFY